MIIREAIAEDTPILLSMAGRFLRATPYGLIFHPTEDQLLDLLEIVKFRGVILVADIGDELNPRLVIGMLALVALEHPMRPGELYAEELAWWVEPEHRKGRAGYKMLRRAEAWARHKGCFLVKMVAPILPTGADVGSFYKFMGYTAIETAYQKLLEGD